jgi:hypothetical protein
LQGLALGPGEHRLSCALELKKLGWVEIRVVDKVR